MFTASAPGTPLPPRAGSFPSSLRTAARCRGRRAVSSIRSRAAAARNQPRRFQLPGPCGDHSPPTGRALKRSTAGSRAGPGRDAHHAVRRRSDGPGRSSRPRSRAAPSPVRKPAKRLRADGAGSGGVRPTTGTLCSKMPPIATRPRAPRAEAGAGVGVSASPAGDRFEVTDHHNRAGAARHSTLASRRARASTRRACTSRRRTGTIRPQCDGQRRCQRRRCLQ